MMAESVWGNKLWQLSEQLTGITEPIPSPNTPLR